MKFLLTLLILILVSGCSHVFYQPASVHYLEPFQFKLKYDDIFFQSKDGIKLHGWFFPSSAKSVKGTVVHFHGNAQNISTHFLNLAWIIKQGYNLFVFDYRGYGISEGSPNQAGIYLDALAAIDKGHELREKNGKGVFVIYGQSLGGIIALRALVDEDQSKIDLIVQDSTFSSYREMGVEVLTRRWFTIPLSPLACLFVSDRYASKNILHRIYAPTLVIVGEQDKTVPRKFGEEIYQAIPARQKWLWKLPNGGHIDIFHQGQEHYRQEFLRLLDEISLK